MKKLRELYNIDSDIEIKSIKINSKEVEAGDIFVCTMGVTADRHDFIDEAIKNGASAVVVSKDIDSKAVPIIKVSDTNSELSLLARKFYDYPEEKLKIIGITGTNGKTTVAEIIYQLIGPDKCGYLGTNGKKCAKFEESIINTTPDADRLYKYLNDFVGAGCEYLVMETSSEAFYRNRLTDIKFTTGIVTNITQDHLNIHKTIENYVSCKEQLIKQTTKYSILNSSDQYFERFKKITNTVLTYGESNDTIKLEEYKNNISTITYNNQQYKVKNPYLGKYNAYNIMASITCLLSLDYKIEDIITKVETLPQIPGRMEYLDFNQDYDIILDYAHTPDALDKILSVLNEIKKDRIITVTGSAGGREHDKRNAMGKVVLSKSDYVIFTMDDPREEDVNEIIDQMIETSNNTNYERIINREEAIARAFNMARKDDIILIAGKGRDNYMAVGKEYLPYNDYEVIEKYFN